MAHFELPVLRNDEPAIKERLTQTAYEDILPPRYLKKNSSGEVIEDQEELFERVAKNIAVAEAAHSDYSLDLKPEDLRDEVVDRYEGELPDLVGDGEFVRVTEKTAKFVEYDTLLEVAPGPLVDDVESWQFEFQEAMEQLKFIPNTPTLANAGDTLQQLSACFVNSPQDDIDSIHDKAREAAQVFQSGGGMGYAFHHLRPYGDPVGGTGGIASGPITFMRTYDQMCETIAQGGMRRGAQMAIMSVTHPDVIQFIHAKDKDVSLAETLRLNDPDDFTHTKFIDALEEARKLIDDDGRVPEHLRNAVEGHLSNFNISVGVTEDFMSAVEADSEFVFTNPNTGQPHITTEQTLELYEMFGLGEHVSVGAPLSIPARKIWRKIARGAHENGEPGVVFLSRINEDHSFDVGEYPEYEIHATNPCGEQPLMEYEACNLGHINLSTIVSKGRPLWPEFDGSIDEFLEAAINWQELDWRIMIGTRFLDNVVTMSVFPVPEIEQTVRDNRKIGLGIMGLAQLYIQLGMEYGSDTANEVARRLMEYINHESKKVSSDLAEERMAFENWGDSKWADPRSYPYWFEKQTGLDPDEWGNGYPIRNHNTTTIAPTGTTSMVGNTTGGCEPIYNVANFKNVSDDVQGEEMLIQFDSLFLKTLEANGIDVEGVKAEAERQMKNDTFSGIESLSAVPDELAELFVTTDDLSAKEHASVQCALQHGVDSAISKTVNAPHSDTVEDALEVFEYVYENGGKGVTYYRDGTRTKQVLTTRQNNQALDELTDERVLSYVAENKSRGDFIQDVIEAGDLEMWRESESSVEPEDRPRVLSGKTYKVQTGYGSLYVVVNSKDGRPFEVMATVGKSGATMEADTEAIARLISLALRSGVATDEVIDQLQGIEADRVGWEEDKAIKSVADGIAYALEQAIGVVESSGSIGDTGVVSGSVSTSSVSQSPSTTESDGGALSVVGCPNCGADDVVMSEGCKTCESCGWSEC